MRNILIEKDFIESYFFDEIKTTKKLRNKNDEM